jgi:hypothetical protein
MKSYEKMLDDMLTLPAMEYTREIFGEYTGFPMYSQKHISRWPDCGRIHTQGCTSPG